MCWVCASRGRVCDEVMIEFIPMFATGAEVAIFAALASTAVGVYSSMAQADAQEDAARYNAAVAENDANAAAQQSQYEAQRIRDRNRRILASQRANQAKSGLALTGSFSDVQLDSAIQGEMDALAAIYTGQINAGSAEARAQLSRMEGRAAKRAGYLGAGGSLLTGASGVASISASTPKAQPSFSAPSTVTGYKGQTYTKQVGPGGRISYAK